MYCPFAEFFVPLYVFKEYLMASEKMPELENAYKGFPTRWWRKTPASSTFAARGRLRPLQRIV
jgi:hypothetical protein